MDKKRDVNSENMKERSLKGECGPLEQGKQIKEDGRVRNTEVERVFEKKSHKEPQKERKKALKGILRYNLPQRVDIRGASQDYDEIKCPKLKKKRNVTFAEQLAAEYDNPLGADHNISYSWIDEKGSVHIEYDLQGVESDTDKDSIEIVESNRTKHLREPPKVDSGDDSHGSKTGAHRNHYNMQVLRTVSSNGGVREENSDGVDSDLQDFKDEDDDINPKEANGHRKELDSEEKDVSRPKEEHVRPQDSKIKNKRDRSSKGCDGHSKDSRNDNKEESNSKEGDECERDSRNEQKEESSSKEEEVNSGKEPPSSSVLQGYPVETAPPGAEIQKQLSKTQIEFRPQFGKTKEILDPDEPNWSLGPTWYEAPEEEETGDPFQGLQEVPRGYRERRLLLLGACDTGKSCIASRLVYNQFYLINLGTIEDEHHKVFKVNDHYYYVEIMDMEGQAYHSNFGLRYRLCIHGYILVYAVDDWWSFDTLKIINDKLIKCMEADPNEVRRIVIGNKCELKEIFRQVDREEVEKWCVEQNIPHFECSARTGEGLQEAFEEMCRQTDNFERPEWVPSQKKGWCSIQ